MTNPRFSEIKHPDLAPEWMTTGLDEIYDRLGDEINSVGFGFWVDNYYDDNNNYSTKAHFWATIKNQTGEAAESRLDEIPAMRRLERRAGELWNTLPISYDSEASIQGDVNFVVSPGEIQFGVSYDGEDLSYVGMVAEFKDGAWHCYDQVIVYADISETLRATATPERLAEAINITSFGFKDSVREHEVIHAEIDEDDGIVLHYKPGLFRHYEAEGDRD